MSKVIKKRNWTFVMYPESAPSDWEERLQKTGLEAFVSPLHNCDTNPTGEVKKEHWHVCVLYPGPTTYNCVKSLCDEFNATIPQPLESVRGIYRYCTHKDNPEKYQYDEKDIKTFNGFNILNYTEMTKAEIGEHKRHIQMLIREKNITDYDVLLDFLLDEGLYEEHEVANTHTILFNSYITSRRNRMREEGSNSVAR